MNNTGPVIVGKNVIHGHGCVCTHATVCVAAEFFLVVWPIHAQTRTHVRFQHFISVCFLLLLKRNIAKVVVSTVTLLSDTMC